VPSDDNRLTLTLGTADYSAINFDHVNNIEQQLPNIPYAFRVYPASAANWLTPLTSANNFTHTVNFCGGINLTSATVRCSYNTSCAWWIMSTYAAFSQIGPVYGPPAVDTLTYPTDNSCTSIRPLDANPTWQDFDFLPQGRGMGSALILPDLTVLVINGVAMGTAGYVQVGSPYSVSYTSHGFAIKVRRTWRCSLDECWRIICRPAPLHAFAL
jgi:hypothetical protein